MTNITWTKIPGLDGAAICLTERGTYLLWQRGVGYGYSWNVDLTFFPAAGGEAVELLTLTDSPYCSGFDLRRDSYQAWADRYVAGAVLAPVFSVKGKIIGYAETEGDARTIAWFDSKGEAIGVTEGRDIDVGAGQTIPRGWMVNPPRQRITPIPPRASAPVAADSAWQ